MFFHLDPFWADANVDFVAIDNYLPLSDWRDGNAHLDYADGRRITDRDYLDGNVEGGEHFDWFYADQAARDAQTRTPIADADPANEPWVFRFKDVQGWWANAHHDRPGGVRSASATAWVPQGKPIHFTELGCPAVDRGTQSAQRLRRREVVGVRAALLLARARATISSSAARSRPRSITGPTQRTTRFRLCTADA